MAQQTLTERPEVDGAVVLDDELAAPVTPLVVIAGLAALVLLLWTLWTLIWGVIGVFR